jgi:hypothetical protein
VIEVKIYMRHVLGFLAVVAVLAGCVKLAPPELPPMVVVPAVCALVVMFLSARMDPLKKRRAERTDEEPDAVQA